VGRLSQLPPSCLPPVSELALRCNWLALLYLIWLTDVDSASLASTQANVDRNSLSERISVFRADPTGPILFLLTQDPAASCATRRAPYFFSWLTTGTRANLISACATHRFMLAQRKLVARLQQGALPQCRSSCVLLLPVVTNTLIIGLHGCRCGDDYSWRLRRICEHNSLTFGGRCRSVPSLSLSRHGLNLQTLSS